MVRTVHMNHFYETSLQISDPKIEFLTKTDFLKNGNVQNFWKCTFWAEKSPCGVAPNIEEGLRIHPNKIHSFLQKSGKVGFP